MLKYLKGTYIYSIAYSRLKGIEILKGYIDSDYTRDITDYKLTYRSIFILLEGLLAWNLKK